MTKAGSLEQSGVFQQAVTLLGHEFRNEELLLLALTHASRADHKLESNERLEFLGDAVLGMVVCEYLFDHYPHLLEGDLTKIKSMVVSRDTCARTAKRLGLDELLRLGKGMSNRGDVPKSLAAGVFEAIIGALYIDAGLETTRTFILESLEPRLKRAVRSGHQQNFKSALQQLAQRTHDHTPNYCTLDEKGPDHAKCFEVCVEIGARRFPSSWGPSKKAAEQLAALNALMELGFVRMDESGEVHLERPDPSIGPRIEAEADDDAA